MENDPLIDVAAFVYPDGTVFWMKDPTADSMAEEVELWKKHHPEFADLGATIGFVKVRMPESKYQGITCHHPRF
jgi:hypothetical protein